MKSSSVLQAGTSKSSANRAQFQFLPEFESVNDLLNSYQGDDHIYLIYPDRIRRSAQVFLDGFLGKSLFAVKSNPHPSVIALLWEAGIRQFDIASMRELEFMASHFPQAELYLMHPVKSRNLIARAYELGVRNFVLDCEEELFKILDGTNHAQDLNLFIRLALGTSDAALPLNGKFGADFETATHLLRSARKVSHKLGVSFHVGSQCIEPASFDRAIEFASRLVLSAGVEIEVLDVGGGFPVEYPGMKVPRLNAFFDVIQKSLLRNKMDHCEWLCEPGRALCAKGGSSLVRVELRKGRDLYLNDGAFGSLYDAAHFHWKYPVTLHRNRPPIPMKSQDDFRLFGPTCDSMDVIAGPVSLPADIAEGDWIEFAHLGAYGFSMATQFNGFFSNTFVAIKE